MGSILFGVFVFESVTPEAPLGNFAWLALSAGGQLCGVKREYLHTHTYSTHTHSQSVLLNYSTGQMSRDPGTVWKNRCPAYLTLP